MIFIVFHYVFTAIVTVACSAGYSGVQTFKVAFEKTEGDLEILINRFLSQYRITPQATTCQPPAQMLNDMAESEITCGHRTFSAHITIMTGRLWSWEDNLTAHFYYYQYVITTLHHVR